MAEETYNDYPAAASANAKKAIDWKEKYGREEVTAGTAVGWARAHQLANKENLSADTVARMSAFNRHRKNSKISPEHKAEPWKDNGYVAWLIWGGDEGVDWAIDKMKDIKESKTSKPKMKHVKLFESFVNEGKSATPEELKQVEELVANTKAWKIEYTNKFGVKFVSKKHSELYVYNEGGGWCYELRVKGEVEQEDYSGEEDFETILELADDCLSYS
jgi:hypothetical protein